MSHATKIKEADARIRRRMESLLGYEAEQLNELEFTLGLAWLNDNMVPAGVQGGEALVRRLAEAADFWNWWKNQWRRLDAELNPSLKVSIVSGRPVLWVSRASYGTVGHQLATWRQTYQNLHAQDASKLRPDAALLKEMLRTAA